MLGRSGSGRDPIDSNVFLPMTTGLPRVWRRNHFMSSGSRQGRALSAPITPFSATATMRETIIGM
jgi:hypothetical protein